MDFDFVSVIVPAHNEEEYINKCLSSLKFQDYPKDKYEIIVVDNDSQDRTQDIARQFNVKLIFQDTGPVGAVRNAGAKQAKGELLAFIDADCTAPVDWLSKGVSLISKNEAVYGGGCDIQEAPHWIERAWLLKNKTAPKDLLGCCIFIKKDIFLKIGMFDEDITSGEDTKLSNSLKIHYHLVVMTEDLNVIHLGNPATLKAFFLRQVWHSENYLQNWHETRLDPTFYFLLVFLFGLLSFILQMADKSINGYFLSIAIVFGIPSVFTAKRLRRSKKPLKNLRNLPAIYVLDFVYVCGRTLGLCKSAWKVIK